MAEDVVEFGKRIKTFEEMKQIERLRKDKQAQTITGDGSGHALPEADGTSRERTDVPAKKARGRPPKSKTGSETEQ